MCVGGRGGYVSLTPTYSFAPQPSTDHQKLEIKEQQIERKIRLGIS